MLRAIVFTPILFVLVLFALSNPQTVQLHLWPLEGSAELPLSVAILLAMAAALILGAVMLWVSALGARMRARRAESQVRELETQLANLKSRLAAAPLALPARG